MSSNKQQSTSTTSLPERLVLTKREIELAKRQAIKELSSLPLFVKNGERLHSNLSADDKKADEEIVRTALTSIQDMHITQSSITVLIKALHRFGAEAKYDTIVDLESA